VGVYSRGDGSKSHREYVQAMLEDCCSGHTALRATGTLSANLNHTDVAKSRGESARSHPIEWSKDRKEVEQKL